MRKRFVGGKRPTASGPGQSGFTLIEVAISLSLIGLFFIVLGGIIQSGFSVNTNTTRRADASSLAFKKVQDYINIDFDSVPIGDDLVSYEVEDFSSEVQALNLANPSGRVYIEPASELVTRTTTTTTDFAQTIAADSAFVSGSEIGTVAVFDDQSNSHWNQGRISDDNFSNYTYNAYDPGPDNKPLPSIDLGSAQTVGTIRVEWWTCSYGANNFRIEAKNSAPTNDSGWTTIVSGLSDNGIPCSSTASAQQDIDVSSNSTPYRYWRMFMVDGTHSSWNVLSEFEAFAAGVPGDIVEQQGSDATDAPGDLYFSSSDLQMSQDGSRGQQSVGIIFDDLDVVQAATVNSAYIEFTADESDSDSVSLLVSGVDEDNAVSWSGSYAVDNAVDTDASDGRTGTAATTNWSPGAWTAGAAGSATQVDVTAIVQEIVNRPGWTADNDMAFAIQYLSGSGERVAERSPAPELVIDWSTSETTTSTDPFEDVDMDGDVDNPTLLKIRAVIEFDSFGDRKRVEYATFIHKFGIGS